MLSGNLYIQKYIYTCTDICSYRDNLSLDSGSQLGVVILPPGRHLSFLEAFLVVIIYRRGECCWHLVRVEARDVAKLPAVHRRDPLPPQRKIIWHKSVVLMLRSSVLGVYFGFPVLLVLGGSLFLNLYCSL